MNSLKFERLFLVMVLGALLLFGGMVFVFSSAQSIPSTRQVSSGSLGVPPENQGAGQGTGPAQEVYLRALSSGTYDKSEVTVRKGIPVNLHFSAEANAGCGRYLSIYGLNVTALSRAGEETVVQFTPHAEGVFEYNCGMRMFRPGRLRVVP